MTAKFLYTVTIQILHKESGVESHTNRYLIVADNFAEAGAGAVALAGLAYNQDKLFLVEKVEYEGKAHIV